LPQAPNFAGEQEYFDYMGAPVVALADLRSNTLQTVTVAGDTVFVLRAGEHFTSVSSGHPGRIVEGNTSVLCRVGRSHRIILSDDLSWTYLVIEKVLGGPDSVRLSLRRARPISNVLPIQEILGDDHA
jgi:hypothetical protein